MVIEAAHRYGRKFLLTSTCEVHGKNNDVPLAEDANRLLGSRLIARWAHSSGKAVEEILAYAYYHERNLEAVLLRLLNTVGPRQDPAYGNVIPSVSAASGSRRAPYRLRRRQPHPMLRSRRRHGGCDPASPGPVRCLRRGVQRGRSGGDVHAGLRPAYHQADGGAPEHCRSGRVSNRPGPTIEIIHYENAYTGGFEDMQRRLPTSPRWKPSQAGAAPQVSTRYSRRPGSLLQEAGIGHREIMVSEGRK